MSAWVPSLALIWHGDWLLLVLWASGSAIAFGWWRFNAMRAGSRDLQDLWLLPIAGALAWPFFAACFIAIVPLALLVQAYRWVRPRLALVETPESRNDEPPPPI